MACPWAHRALIMRALKGLENFVSVSVVHWPMLDKGWTFEDGPGVIPDTVNGARYLYEIYTRANPEYSGRVTIPLLWDTKLGRIVNNESSDIIRIFNSDFDSIGALLGYYYLEGKRHGIGAIHESVVTSVYKDGRSGLMEKRV